MSAQLAISELDLALSLLTIVETAPDLKRRKEALEQANALCNGVSVRLPCLTLTRMEAARIRAQWRRVHRQRDLIRKRSVFVKQKVSP